MQGATDSPLTKLGIRQAEIARDHYQQEGIRFDAAYASTSERASDTLEIVYGSDKDYTRLKGLKEWNFGAFEAESERLNPSLPYEDFFVYYGGEDEQEVRDRVYATVLDIVKSESEKGSDRNILIVSHGASCSQFLKKVTDFQGSPKKEYGFTNCSAMVFDYDGGEFTFNGIINHDYQGVTQTGRNESLEQN